jgi:hypothetical protein
MSAIIEKLKTLPDPYIEQQSLPQPVQRLFVMRSGKRFEVASLEDASQKWCAFRDATGAGASEIGEDVMIYNQAAGGVEAGPGAAVQAVMESPWKHHKK